MRFSKLTIGSGSSMAQIIEGDFEIQSVDAGDDKTVPMFIGVRGKRLLDGTKRRRESLIAVPVGAVTIAEIMDEEDPEDESLDVPELG